MKKASLFIVIIAISINLMSQTLEWVNSIGGSERDDSKAVLLLQDQTIIQVGNYRNSASVTTADTSFEINSGAGNTVFIQKLSQSGNHLWTKQVGDSGSAYCNSACLDKDENILITGFFSGTVDFDPGIGVFELNTIVGNSYYYILKLNVNGDFIWARNFGGNSFNYGYDIATDSARNVYTTGHFGGSVDFIGNGNSCISHGGLDIFIHKLDADGNPLWAKTIGGGYSDVGYGLDVDDNGNVFIGGIFGASVDFNPGEGIKEISSTGELDAFALKLTSNGDFEWVRTFGGIWYDYAYDVKCTSENDLIVTGSFFSDADFDSHHGGQILEGASGSDVYILKITNLGWISWVRGFGGITQDEGYAVSVDSLGNIYSTGFFCGDVDFDPGNNEFSISSKGGEDVFVQKLDANGNFVWATSFGGNDRDYGYSLVSDNLNHIYVCGSFKDDVDFGLNSLPNLLTSAGIEDSYCVKIKEPNISVSEQIYPGYILFPNPTSGLVYLVFPDDTYLTNEDSVSVEIYSCGGRFIKRQSICNKQLSIDLSDLISGIYFIKLSNSEKFSFQKVILEKL